MTTNTIVSTLALDIVDNDVLEITPRSAVEAKVLSKEQAKLLEKEKAKQAKLQEKEQAKQAKLQEKEQAKQVKLLEKEQAKQTKKRSRSKDQCEEPPEKRKRGRPQKEPKMITCLGENNHDYVDSLGMTVMEAEYITEEEDEDEDMDSESDDEEETLVTEFTFQNKWYYKCEENTLYDPESHIELGYYNPIDNTIVLSDV